MHHKYVVRDAQSVWTGSTNWTRTRGVARRTSSSRSSRPPSPARTSRTSASSGRRPTWRGRAGVSAQPGTRRRHQGPRLVLARLRPRARAQALARHRACEAPRTDRVAGHHVGPDPRHARRERRRGEGRHGRRRGPDADQEVLHQWAANEHASWKIAALHRRSRRRLHGKLSTPYRPGRCTTTCTRRWSSPTTSSSWGATTSPTPARSTPRTCWRSRRRAGRGGRAFVDEVRAQYPRIELPVVTRIDRRKLRGALDAAPQVERDTEVAGEEREPAAPDFLARCRPARCVHRERPSTVQPQLVLGQREELEQRIAVPRRAVAQPGSLARAARPAT